MEETQKVKSYNIIAGVLFGILSLWSLIHVHSFYTILELLGYVGITIALFIKKKQVITVSAAVLVISELIKFILYIRANIYFLDTLVDIFPFLITFIITGLISMDKVHFKKIWFVPAICIGIDVLLGFIDLLKDIFSFNTHFLAFSFLNNLVFPLLTFFAFLLANMWMAYTNGIPKKVNTVTNADGTITNVVVNEGYCSLVKHVLLLLFTFGIWQLIWIYKTTAYLNCVEDEEYRNPTTKLLLCMFVPFYSIFWIYKSAQRIDKLAKTKNIQSDLSTLCLILAIFIPIIAYILMQDKINAVATAKN